MCGWNIAGCILGLTLFFATASVAQTPRELANETLPADAIWLESLNLQEMSQDWGQPHVGRSVENNPISLGGIVFPHGVGSHARSEFVVNLKGVARRFVSAVGVDDEKRGAGSVVFQVYVDGKLRASSGVMRGGDAPKVISVDLTGARRMTLVIDDAGDGIDSDHGDWAGAMILLEPGAHERPEAASPVRSAPPKIHHNTPTAAPAIHGPRIVGATPGHPFLFLIPATGQGPLRYMAHGLPAGLTVNERTGIITGSLKKAGTWRVELVVHGPKGTARRSLAIVGGIHKLALTPPMGWNSWNVWAGAVDDAKVRAAADWMVRSGLAAHGYQYINIDDTWEGPRRPDGTITSNNKFPDMKALADYVHSRGLKLGIYSSPGPTTCAGFPGSFGHEQQDAATYAEWGIDYLKYDWCSYGNVATGEGLERLQKPYLVMRHALDNVPRDIVYSLCQYGMGNVWEWGAKVGGNCWRTTGDISDNWGSLNGIAFSQNGHEKFAGPGHWNDPDMLVVGKVGWGPNLHPSHLTPNEQLLHITMWCLQSAPLLLGCDLSQLDPFTLDLITNDEVLDVDQDPLGKPAGRKAQSGMTEVWARPLYDGTLAVGLFNRGSEPAQVEARWEDLGIRGPQLVRDLWLQKDLGVYRGVFQATVPAHGAVLVKIGRPKR